MTLAAGFAILGLLRQMAAKQEKDLASKLGKTLQDPLSTAGVILLITGAGGAFGAMIRMSGVGESVGSIAEEFDISYVFAGLGRDRLHPNRSRLGYRVHDHRCRAHGRRNRRRGCLGLPQGLCLPCHRIRLDHPFLDERQWILGRSAPQWFHRKGNPQDLVRSADCHLSARALPLPARLGPFASCLIKTLHPL